MLCHLVFDEVCTGTECAVTDFCIAYSHEENLIYLGCPDCGMIYEVKSGLDNEMWSAWVSNGDGTHSRFLKVFTSIIQTEPCHPGDEDEIFCDVCGGTYINPEED